MSLYGSLFSSVAGLRAQSNKVGVISDNISNVNTVGYKQGQASFETLVTSSGIASIYSPGGVLSSNRALVSKQGLIQGTDNGTDIAISGSGFFVVRNNTTADSEVFYTRAGSFRQDNLGNFRNAAGFYLQGWPLDREGRLPGEPGNLNTNSANNLTSLERVNLLAATGAAAETTSAQISANLKSSQTVYPGAQVTADMDTTTPNANQPSRSIIVPGYLNGSAIATNKNSIERGDKFTISQGNGLTNTYRYGGFTFSRDVTTATGADSKRDLIISPQTLVANPIATTLNSATVTVTAPNHGLAAGDTITLSGLTAVNGIQAADLNQKFVVQSAGTNTFTITVASQANATSSGGGSSASMSTRSFAGNILDASSSTQRFLATTGTAGFTTASLSFSITSTSVGTVNFTYTNGTPNVQQRQFNTLENLAGAINNVAGLTARVSGGRLYVASADANEAVTFSNGSAIGDSSGATVLAGIDWVRELGLQNITSGQDRFHSLDTLNALVRNSSGLAGNIRNQFTEAQLDINITDPLDTISLTDLPAAGALSSFASATPFGTTINSNVVSVTHPSPHGLSSGDVVNINPTSFTGYPAPFTAVSAFTTTNASATVTIAQAGHTFTNGQVVNIDPTTISGWPGGTINGIPLQAFQGNFVVSGVVAGTSYQITVATPATSGGTAGAGTMTVSPTFNGIPYTALNGRFEVTVTGPSTYTIKTTKIATSTGNVGQSGLVVTPPNNRGSILAELGLVNSLAGGAYSVQTLGPNGPQYNPADSDFNIAGGNITAQFSQNLRVYDSLGTPHDLKVGFIKTAPNTWAAEIYAANPSEVSSTYSQGQIATGTIVFNGDGSLRSVSQGLSNAIPVVWSNGAEDSSIRINWGTAGEPFGTVNAASIGKTDGMTQFDSNYRVNFFNQNGAPVGQLVGVTFNEEGFVIANYNNGESQRLYRIPVADFSNPDQLETSSGNVFAETNDSGDPNLRQPGVDGAGKLQSSALETSNVELADQLTDLIVAQRAYQANTKVVTTASDLLDTLNQAIR